MFLHCFVANPFLFFVEISMHLCKFSVPTLAVVLISSLIPCLGSGRFPYWEGVPLCSVIASIMQNTSLHSPVQPTGKEYLWQNVRFWNMKILVMFLLVGPIYENDGAVLNAAYQCGGQKTSTAQTHNFVLSCRGAHVSDTSSLLIAYRWQTFIV